MGKVELPPSHTPHPDKRIQQAPQRIQHPNSTSKPYRYSAIGCPLRRFYSVSHALPLPAIASPSRHHCHGQSISHSKVYQSSTFAW